MLLVIIIIFISLSTVIMNFKTKVNTVRTLRQIFKHYKVQHLSCNLRRNSLWHQPMEMSLRPHVIIDEGIEVSKGANDGTFVRGHASNYAGTIVLKVAGNF